MFEILKSLSTATTVAANVIQRAKIILMAFEKQDNSQIARQLGLERHCVGRWRRRWQLSTDALLAIEMNESHAAHRLAVVDVLSDAHRSGRPSDFTNGQIAEIISLASQSPRDYDRPVDDWTGRELASEAKIRGIADSISTSRVNEFLRMVKLKPQHRKGWCFTTEKDQQEFRRQIEFVCETYLQAESLGKAHGTHTVCVDEMTSLQARERLAASKLPKANQIGKMECQYTRHGTLSLTGSWDVVAGQMIETTVAQTRNGEDFANHIARTIATDPEAEWIFVADNLSTHYGEPIVRIVADLLGVDPSGLGHKKKRKGILGSVASRREFLCNANHRIRFVYLPKHSSWLNQIEIIFGVISKRVMRNGNFTSLEDLANKLRSFVEYFNRTFAKPINWKYDGKAKQSSAVKRPRTWREKTQSRKIEEILDLVE